MASRKLKTNVAVDGTWYGPDSVVPAAVAKRITNPNVWDGADDTSDVGSGEEPPRSGKGSGLDAWRAYADTLGVTVADDASREDVIAAVDEHKKAQG